MKEILIPLNFTTTPTLYDTKQSFSTSDEASGVLTFTTTADVSGTVASLTIRNASENANHQTVRIERLDVNTSPFSYALKNPLPFGQYEGTILLKKNLTVIASAFFLFGVNSSLSAEVLPDLVKAYSLDELVENVETEVSHLKDAFTLTVSETVKGVNKTESSLQAQENVRYLNEHQRKANELERIANENARIAAEVERKDTFDTLVDSEVIEQTVVQEVANEFQEIEATYANRLLSTEQQLADELYKDFTRRRKSKRNPTFVAYGDSNSRYFEGNRALAGSISHAFSSWIDRFCSDYPEFYGSNVINAGYPGERISYGLAHYAENITANNADIVTIGFGTNDIKLSGSVLETYLMSMETMIDNLLTDGISPIVLGIPWFDPAYVNNDMTIYARLPVWNEALMHLCVKKNVEFVDVYNMFLEADASAWFNDTPKRHYSKVAQKVLAQEIFSRILKLNNLASFTKSKFIHETFNLMSMTWVKSYPSTAEFVSYTNGIDPFECIKIPSGTSITINTKSRFAVCFYPRAIATASFSNSIGDVAITNTIDDGLYFPIKRVSGASNAYIGTEAVITITAVGGDLYIRKISIEENPYAYPTKTLPITPRYSKNFIPTGVNAGFKIYLTDLAKEIVYNGVGQWTDGSGYICVGSTADRTAAQVNIPIGFKFLDLETNLRYRWNGVDTWTSF